MASSGRRSKSSRLRQEILRSPESTYIDLFPRTRVRLANVAYHEPAPVDQDSMTPDDLRRHMLAVVFGWDDDIEPLIRDELAFHQPGSTSAVLLSKWLGEVDSDMMAAAISSGNVNSSDWMVLALSSMGGGSSMGKMGQAFVQRLLQQGDFHTSATILLGLGDLEDAVEVYVSRCFYMEAILLTSLIFPTDWQRQAHLVQKWGEFVVENSQQNLAMRCFYATGIEPPLPWGSPSPKMSDSTAQTPSSLSSMLSPPISPPIQERMTREKASLKVITSFDAPLQKQFKFPGLASTDRTPTNGPGVTPIAESAVSPGGTPGGFMRSQQRGMNRQMTPGGFSRNRLPSIGETPVDVTLPPFPRPSQLPTPDNSGSDLEKEKRGSSKSQPAFDHRSQGEEESAPPLLLSSARYEPSSATTTKGMTPMTAVPATSVRTTILPSPATDAFTDDKQQQRTRNASRDRKPEGLHIRMPSQDQIQTVHHISKDGVSSGPAARVRSTTLNSLQSGGLSTDGLSTGGLSTGRSDFLSDARSPSVSGRSHASAKSPSISGRSMDQYINSLDEARHHPRKSKYSSRKRHESREGQAGARKPKSKQRNAETSQDRGREGEEGRRYIRPAKRSPSSPVPMSPEHYNEATMTPIYNDSMSGVRSPDIESRNGRSETGGQHSLSKYRSGSKASDYSHRTVRHRSPEGVYDSQLKSRGSSRQPSPRAMLDPYGRGRSKSKGRGGSSVRSPSSPLPFSPQAAMYQRSDSEEDDPLRIVAANRERIRSRHRSSSRRPKGRGTSSRRDPSPDRRRIAEDRSMPDKQPQSAIEPRRFSGDEMLPIPGQSGLRREKSERTQKKELAARELEARRESLLRNPEAPVVPHPSEVSRPGAFSRSQTDLGNSPNSWHPIVPSNHAQRFPAAAMDNGDIVNRGASASVGPYGLPATPRAMRHPRYDNKGTEPIPPVPEKNENVQTLPETYYTGARELPRSMSAPIPEPQMAPPSDLPLHPAFHKGLRQDRGVSNLQPLGSIGQHRRKVSGDQQSIMAPQVAGIEEILAAGNSAEQDEPPILQELQHLAMPPPPPPPPPPAPFSNRNDAESSSLSSNSNVGMIQMVLDNEPEDEGNVIEVPPPPPPAPSHPGNRTRSPPVGTTSPPPSMSRSSSNHRRGRSGDHFKTGIKGITERLRSSSRGRNTKSPESPNVKRSPYESVPPLYF